MVQNGNNGLYQLGEVRAIFRPQPIFNVAQKFFMRFKSDEFRGGHFRTFVWFSGNILFTF